VIRFKQPSALGFLGTEIDGVPLLAWQRERATISDMSKKTRSYYQSPHSDFTTVAFVNPLVWPAADPELAKKRKLIINEQNTLDFFCVPPGAEADIDDMADRYREIHAAEASEGDFVFPNETTILERIVWPLRQAKACYIVENYLGTIALCGMILEMVAILMFELSRPTHNGEPLDEETQRRIFGATFEDLGQQRRVDILRAYGLIGEDQEREFRQAAGIRRGHLHRLSMASDYLAADARSMYRHALVIVETALGPEDASKPWTLRASLVQYLRGKGAPVPIAPPTTATVWTKVNLDGTDGEKVVANPPDPLRPRLPKKT